VAGYGCNLAPFIDFISRFIQRAKPVLIQTFVSKLAIEAFDKSILRRFARLNEVQLHVIFLAPEKHRFAGKLGAVVADNRMG
jgi:hypothetical protein